jgi:hypothetical protein
LVHHPATSLRTPSVTGLPWSSAPSTSAALVALEVSRLQQVYDKI